MKCLKMISITIGFVISLFATQSFAKDLAISPEWSQKIKLFQEFNYKSRSDLYSQSKALLNQVEDDEVLSYQQKVSLRRQINTIEVRIEDLLPELKLVGFRKTLIDPLDPKAGYMLEPDYQ